MKTRRGWLQGYNAQIVVTTGQIIIATDITTDANDVQQLQPMLAQAQANVTAVADQDTVVLGAAVADAGYWSEANAASEGAECELIIATQKDHKQRAALRDAPPPRGRKPNTMTARERMDRKLRTRHGRDRYRRRGASVEPVFGQMKDRQGPLCQTSCRVFRIAQRGGVDIKQWLDMDKHSGIASSRGCCRRRARPLTWSRARSVSASARWSVGEPERWRHRAP